MSTLLKITSQRRRQLGLIANGRVILPALLLSVTLVACGGTGSADEATVGETVTPISIISGDPPRASAVPPNPGASLAAGTPATVGDLAALVEAAWTGVTSYRATSSNSGSGGVLTDSLASPISASPSAGASPEVIPAGGAVVTDEVVMPDLRHQIVREAGTQSEFIAANGLVYVRGAYARVYVDPTADPRTWRALDPTRLPPDSPVAIFVERFAGPEAFTSPFANLQPSTRELPLTPLDVTTVDGRTCQSYRVVQTTQTGERVDITLAIDERNLPCYQETAAGGIVNRTTYGDFNADISIKPPADTVSWPLGGAESSPAASAEAG